MQLEFEQRYEVRDLTTIDVDQSLVRHFALPYKAASDTLGHITIGVTPTNQSEWIGRFPRAYQTPPAIDGVFSTPNANSVCVGSGGQGYIIDSTCPTKVTVVTSFPVTSVLEI